MTLEAIIQRRWLRTRALAALVGDSHLFTDEAAETSLNEHNLGVFPYVVITLEGETPNYHSNQHRGDAAIVRFTIYDLDRPRGAEIVRLLKDERHFENMDFEGIDSMRYSSHSRLPADDEGVTQWIVEFVVMRQVDYHNATTPV